MLEGANIYLMITAYILAGIAAYLTFVPRRG